MSAQLLKSAGLRLMTSQTDIALNKKGKIPWYVYFVGGVIYTVLAGMLFAEDLSCGRFNLLRFNPISALFVQ